MFGLFESSNKFHSKSRPVALQWTAIYLHLLTGWVQFPDAGPFPANGIILLETTVFFFVFCHCFSSELSMPFYIVSKSFMETVARPSKRWDVLLLLAGLINVCFRLVDSSSVCLFLVSSSLATSIGKSVLRSFLANTVTASVSGCSSRSLHSTRSYDIKPSSS